VRVSRKRRGVPEQQEDEDLLNLNAECDEETEAGANFTLPGSHVQTASGRIWTPRGPNSIPQHRHHTLPRLFSYHMVIGII
jgi:hypothetical protein